MKLNMSSPVAGSGHNRTSHWLLPAVDINRLGAGLATGALLGATIGGGGARIAMRAVALLGEGQPGFTVGGTLAIAMRRRRWCITWNE